MDYRDARNDLGALWSGTPAHSERGPSRRLALQLALGTAGYAAAAGAVVAQTAIQTPVDGLTVGWVTVPSQGFEMQVYRAQPAGKTGLPVVLVVQEVFGVHAYIQDVCRRLAREGYLAIAPQLYARQGDASQYTEPAKLMADLVSKVPDAQVLSDLDAAVAWAGGHGGDLGKVAITGFCWGGRIAWLYAAHGPVKAGVAWYGRLVGQTGPLTPKQPLELVSALKAPVLGLYGEKDGGIPLDAVESMKTALQQGSAAAKASQFVVYPDAPHAFHADYRPSYRAAAAEDGWKRALAWFKAHGVA
jgi:carboxymethylenebutenolidase